MPKLIELSKEELINIIIELEENKYACLKITFGLPYHTDEEWIHFINNLLNKD
jgi:hypothetical protein